MASIVDMTLEDGLASNSNVRNRKMKPRKTSQNLE